MSLIREVMLTDTLDNPINAPTEESLQSLIDKTTNLSLREAKIQSGDSYFISHCTKIKKHKIFNVVVTTPASSTEIHFDRNSMLFTSKEAEINVYVGMTTTGALGTPATIINANANSTNVAPVQIYTNPTGNINKGMFVYKEIKYEENKTIPERGNIILRSNTNYLMEIISRKDDNIISIPFEFFVGA